MDIKTLVASVIAAALVAGGILVSSPKAPEPSNLGGSQPQTGTPYFCVGDQCVWNTPITCNTATSTIFGIPNPWGATSTVKLVRFSAVGNATTTTLKVGTSSVAVGVTSVYGIEVNASIATTSAFNLAAGVRNGPVGTTFVDAGASTVSEILIGPNENFVGFATTTATGAGAAQYSGGYTSCSGMVRWERGY